MPRCQVKALGSMGGLRGFYLGSLKSRELSFTHQVFPMIRTPLFTLLCAVAFLASTISAQEAEKVVKTNNAPVENSTPAIESAVKLTEEGKLVGKAFAKVDGEAKPLEAKVTLSRNGVVIDSVTAKEDGSFAFSNVEPGAYQMFGSADGYVGGSSYDVQSCSSGGCSSANLGLQADTGMAYDNYSAAPCSSCGGGFGGGGGFGSGIGRGGLLGNRRLLRLGLIGSVVAIATSDSSPDQ